MINVRFLIGGFGNQLFQIASAKPNCTFSGLFLQPKIRWLFGQTNHEQVLIIKKIPLWISAVALLLLAVDMSIFTFFKRTLFTRLQISKMTSTPALTEWVSFGYFEQDCFTNMAQVQRHFQHYFEPKCNAENVVVHVRGRDTNSTREVDKEVDQIEIALNTIEKRQLFSKRKPYTEIVLHTDDVSRAEGVRAKLANRVPARCVVLIRHTSLQTMVKDSCEAGFFLGSESTLSFWIAVMRGPERWSFLPATLEGARGMNVPKYIEKYE